MSNMIEEQNIFHDSSSKSPMRIFTHEAAAISGPIGKKTPGGAGTHTGPIGTIGLRYGGGLLLNGERAL